MLTPLIFQFAVALFPWDCCGVCWRSVPGVPQVNRQKWTYQTPSFLFPGLFPHVSTRVAAVDSRAGGTGVMVGEGRGGTCIPREIGGPIIGQTEIGGHGATAKNGCLRIRGTPIEPWTSRSQSRWAIPVYCTGGRIYINSSAGKWQSPRPQKANQTCWFLTGAGSIIRDSQTWPIIGAILASIMKAQIVA